MVQKVFILGIHIQALGLARMAQKISLEVQLFNDTFASIARFSNTCDKFHLFRDNDHLLEILVSLAENKQTLLIATNDSLINFLSINYIKLSELYYLSVPDPSVIEICYNKRFTYNKASELEIPIPKSYFPDSLSEIELLADKVKFPVVLKPAIMHTFHKKTGKKVFLCNNPQDLIKYYRTMRSIIPANEVILQEFIRGGSKVLYSFGSFAANGKVYAGLSANRIRQNPMDFGNSTCYAITVVEPEFESLAKKFLNSINYFGMSEVEFMFDEETNQFKLLEINPRAWKWHSIANKLNINFLKMMVDFLNGQEVDTYFNNKKGIGWIERLTDIYISLKEIVKGKITPIEYLKSIMIKKESAVWSFKDPLPALMYLILSPYLFIKRK